MTSSFDPNHVAMLLEPVGDDLDDARHLLRHILTNAPVTALVAHVARADRPRFELDYVSMSGRSVLGTTPAEFREKFSDWLDKLDLQSRADLTRQYLQLLQGDIDELHSEFKVASTAGNARTLGIKMRRDESGTQLYGFVFDVTGRRELDKALADHQQVLNGVVERSPDLFVVTDLEGSISFVNPVARELVGYEMYRLVGESIHSLIHPDDGAVVREAFWSLAPDDERPGVVRARVKHADGGWITLDIRSRLLLDAEGNISGVVGICRDASPQMELEQRLREAKEVAERANHAKDEFLSRMSHELRTPLNAVLGFAQLLELGGLAPDERESVDQIRRAGTHLLQLIDEVLDIARIEAGKLSVSLEPVNVREVVDTVTDLMRPVAHQHGVHLVVADLSEAWVMADRQRIMQVLLNVLSNAIKFNREGGKVLVSVDDQTVDGSCRLLVTDTGRGIDEPELDRLFQPFEQILADRVGITGTGIGLALSRALSIQMGGTLSALSRIGEGTTFALCLRRADPLAATEPAVPEVAGPARSTSALRILHIEDNKANRELIEHALRWRGADEVVAASQGLLGLALAQADPPDVVLLDLHLPDMDGVDVLRRLRLDPATATTPIIVLSADATARQVARVMDEGADHYMTKPVDIAGLLRVLDGYRS